MVMGCKALGGLMKILISKDVSREAMIMWNNNKNTGAIYGSDMCILSRTMKNRLDARERMILRKIFSGFKMEMEFGNKERTWN